jgi:hypothetical protein
MVISSTFSKLIYVFRRKLVNESLSRAFPRFTVNQSEMLVIAVSGGARNGLSPPERKTSDAATDCNYFPTKANRLSRHRRCPSMHRLTPLSTVSRRQDRLQKQWPFVSKNMVVLLRRCGMIALEAILSDRGERSMDSRFCINMIKLKRTNPLKAVLINICSF